MAIDDIVDTYQVPPNIEEIEDEDLSTTCEYCQNTAIYIVSN